MSIQIFNPESVQVVVTYVLPVVILVVLAAAYYFGFGAALAASKRVGPRR
jgi:hypothetical protein